MTDWQAITRLDSPTGADLALRASQASGKPRGIVHINHGMAEHALRYARFVAELNAAGWHAIAQDHRGHGHTKAVDAPLGTFAARDGHLKVLEDCLAVNAEARRLWPGLPVIWFGHSMGGIIGTAYCTRYSDTIAGAALWNFSVDGGALVSLLGLLIRAERMFKGSDAASTLATRLTFDDWNRKFRPNRTDFDWLSRDEAEVDAYVTDPLCGFACSTALWLDVLALIGIGSDDAQLAKIRRNLPVDLVGGEADPSSVNATSIIRLGERLRKAGLADVTVRTLPETRHETLNELNRDAETQRLIERLETMAG